jgi:hypothetical protein
MVCGNVEQADHGRRADLFGSVNSADAFDQPHELVPHRLIVDRGQRFADAQVERIGHQRLHLASRLADGAFALEVVDALTKGGCDLLEPPDAHAVDTSLVLLNLLERDAELGSKFVLAHFSGKAPGADFLAERLVGRGD